jgi:predicted metal-dependent phosphoesterase TrpH
VTLRRSTDRSVALVDLHLHTTASDGRCTPAELVARAAAAGVTVMAATDHDTTAGVAEVRLHAERLGILAIPGIEITAVEEGRDVHMLGYFFDEANSALSDFLAAQRATRLERIHAIARRLDSLGMPIDIGPMLADAARQTGTSIGRPKVARAMIEAGYVASVRDAFDIWLARGRPAFVERAGASPEAVISIVHDAGGLVSLAHPGRTAMDGRIAALCEAGLDAIEVFHPDHDPAAVARYERVAHDLQLLVSGGSDFHADPAHGLEPAAATLTPHHWERLYAARERHAAG